MSESRNSLVLLFLFVLTGAAAAAPPPGYFLALGIYRPSTNHVYAYADLTARTLSLDGDYGLPGDIPLAGDFDGNGVLDLAVYRAGSWYIDVDHDYAADQITPFGGVAGDIPLAGDFDGDGMADLVIYRAGTWFIRSSANGQTSQRHLGDNANDQPVVADFDGDGLPDLGVFRAGTWLVQTHSATGADIVDRFGGLAEDRACAVDWDHDGRADLCIYRNGIWSFKSLGEGGLLDAYAFGGAGDIPLSGGAFDYGGAIYVRAGAAGTQDGTPAHPFSTIGKAFDAAADGSVIRVGAGNYTENVALFGPTVNYAPGKFGKNNLKLLALGSRAVKLAPASGDAITLWGSTNNFIDGFAIGAASGRGVVLIGGAGSVAPTLPGAGVALSLNTIDNTSSYGVLITGSSQADIRHNKINSSRTKSGIGGQSGAPSATIAYNEISLNGYQLASGVDGNGIEAQSSSDFTIVGNQIHDNNRFGIIAINDSRLHVTANTIVTNRLNGILIGGGPPNDTTTTQINGNWIAGNGVDLQNGIGYNGLEYYISCVGTHTVNGNTFDSNSLNGMFIGSGTVTIMNNVFRNNTNGITVSAESGSSANTVMTLFGNAFTNNLQDGVFAGLGPSSNKSLTATIGGLQAGQANAFTGQGFHGIGCTTKSVQLTCPSGGNTFAGNTNDIESLCPSTCVK